MRTTTMYVAGDGTRFDTKAQCLAYEICWVRSTQPSAIVRNVPKTRTVTSQTGAGTFSGHKDNAYDVNGRCVN